VWRERAAACAGEVGGFTGRRLVQGHFRLIFGDFYLSVFKVGSWTLFYAFFCDLSAIWESFWETVCDFFEVYGILLDCTPSCTKTYFLRFQRTLSALVRLLFHVFFRR